MRGFVSGRSGRGLQAMLLVSALALLSGCGWFDGSPVQPEKLRPGAEKALSPSDALPPPPANQNYDGSMAAVDENRGGPAIGSIIAASGGQQAQIDKQEKEQAERDKTDREARDKAAQERAAQDLKDADKGTGQKYSGREVIPVAIPAGEPPTEPAAPARAPVSGAPIPPPTSDATPPAPPPVPSDKPSGPDAMTKPAGT